MSAIEAMKLALEALEVDPFEMVEDANGHMVFLTNQAITALREALAEQPAQQQEPVAEILDRLEVFVHGLGKAILHELREALALVNEVDQEQPAQQEQEPAFYRHEDGHLMKPDRAKFLGFDLNELQPLYTSPPTLSLAQRQARSADTWVGLTDEEILIMSRYDLEYAALIGEVQRKLKEKNSD